MLDAQQRTFWRRNGYLWLRGCLSPDETAAVRRWTDEITGWADTPGKWMRYYERANGERMLARIENFLPHHEGLHALFERGRVPAILAELLGEPAVVFKDKVNLKAAGGQGFAPHQDGPAYVDFGLDFFVTVMVPVDAFTLENGCLEMAREAATDRLLPHPGGALPPEVDASYTYDPVLAQPGDVILFDSYVPHRSGPNRSGGPRRSYYVTYNRLADGDHRAAYYARKRELFPQECERVPGVDYARIGQQFNLANPFE